MNLGNSLFEARKKSGLSQEEVAEKLGVSSGAISKWETGETLPDIRQAKMMSKIYKISLDDLIDFDTDIKEIEAIILNTDEKKEAKIDWTNVWAKKYPILNEYQDKVNIPNFAFRIDKILNELKEAYNFSEQDAMLVLKDILYNVWKIRKDKK